MIELAENRYGKSRVRLMKVTRHAHGHDLREWTVQVLLRGDFESAHVEGDNSKILADRHDEEYGLLDRAQSSQATSMEEYAKELIDFLLGRNPQVSSACRADREHDVEAADGRRQAASRHLYARQRRAADDQRGAGAGWRIQDRLGAGEYGDSEDGEVGLRGLHQGVADDAAGDERPPLRHGGHGGVELWYPTDSTTMRCGRRFARRC